MNASLLLFAAISAAAVAKPPAPPARCTSEPASISSCMNPMPKLLQLFGPEGERAWAGKHWNPEFLHPQPAADIEGAVFTIPHGAIQRRLGQHPPSTSTRAIFNTSISCPISWSLSSMSALNPPRRPQPASTSSTREQHHADGNAHVAAMSHGDQSAGKEWQQAIDDYLASVEKKRKP